MPSCAPLTTMQSTASFHSRWRRSGQSLAMSASYYLIVSTKLSALRHTPVKGFFNPRAEPPLNRQSPREWHLTSGGRSNRVRILRLSVRVVSENDHSERGETDLAWPDSAYARSAHRLVSYPSSSSLVP